MTPEEKAQEARETEVWGDQVRNEISDICSLMRLYKPRNEYERITSDTAKETIKKILLDPKYSITLKDTLYDEGHDEFMQDACEALKNLLPGRLPGAYRATAHSWAEILSMYLDIRLKPEYSKRKNIRASDTLEAALLTEASTD